MINDFTALLPWHTSRTWQDRSLDQIDKIVVHQSLSTGTLEAINKYHITPGSQNHLSNRGAPHIAYHFAIKQDGTIVKLNEIDKVVWHTRGANSDGIGIMLMGDFSGPSYDGSQEPTGIQLKALGDLLELLTIFLPKLTRSEVYGHKDFGKDNCPGNVAYSYIQEFKNS